MTNAAKALGRMIPPLLARLAVSDAQATKTRAAFDRYQCEPEGFSKKPPEARRLDLGAPWRHAVDTLSCRSLIFQ